MSDIKTCSCGGNMRDLGERYLNLSYSRFLGDGAMSNMAVQIFVCESCKKLEFYSLDFPEEETTETYEEKMYRTYKDTPTAKLERILEKGDYTDECKAVIILNTDRNQTVFAVKTVPNCVSFLDHISPLCSSKAALFGAIFPRKSLSSSYQCLV